MTKGLEKVLTAFAGLMEEYGFYILLFLLIVCGGNCLGPHERATNDLKLKCIEAKGSWDAKTEGCVFK